MSVIRFGDQKKGHFYFFAKPCLFVFRSIDTLEYEIVQLILIVLCQIQQTF